jgi:hypothetical protein
MMTRWKSGKEAMVRYGWTAPYQLWQTFLKLKLQCCKLQLATLQQSPYHLPDIKTQLAQP